MIVLLLTITAIVVLFVVWARQWQVGRLFTYVAFIDAGTKACSAIARISEVDYDQRTITLDAAWNAGVGDYIVMAGDSMRVPDLPEPLVARKMKGLMHALAGN